MNKQLSRFKKFFFNKKLRISISITTITIILLYILVLFLINNIDSHGILYQICLVCKEMLVVIFSIISTTLLTTWLIEVDSRNKLYGDVICNDFLASDEFHNTLTEENRKNILNNLEKHMYFNNNTVKEEMHKSIIGKLQKFNKGYYYTECKHSVVCSIDSGLITKEIKRTLKLRSFDPTYKLDSFKLIHLVYLEKPSIKSLELKTLKINDDILSPVDGDGDVTLNEGNDIGEQLKSCGYDKYSEFVCVNPIVLSCNKDCVIEITYRTTVGVKDNSFTFRTGLPCKNFSLDFRLNNGSSKAYSLSSYAFGFADDAITSVHNGSRDYVKVNFNDWIFKSDGVVVVISKN